MADEPVKSVARLRWHDFISINLFWQGMNVRNTALDAMSTAGLVIAMLVQPAAE